METMQEIFESIGFLYSNNFVIGTDNMELQGFVVEEDLKQGVLSC